MPKSKYVKPEDRNYGKKMPMSDATRASRKGAGLDAAADAMSKVHKGAGKAVKAMRTRSDRLAEIMASRPTRDRKY